MNINNSNQRARAPLTGPLNGSFSSRATQDSRPVQPQSASATNTETISRAEQFDSEKKRIVESCFSKKDADGIGKSTPIDTMNGGRVKISRLHSQKDYIPGL